MHVDWSSSLAMCRLSLQWTGPALRPGLADLVNEWLIGRAAKDCVLNLAALGPVRSAREGGSLHDLVLGDPQPPAALLVITSSPVAKRPDDLLHHIHQIVCRHIARHQSFLARPGAFQSVNGKVFGDDEGHQLARAQRRYRLKACKTIAGRRHDDLPARCDTRDGVGRRKAVG